MNPRVVLLVSIAALFIATWSMDSRYQKAVVLSRKTEAHSTMAGVTLKPIDEKPTQLTFEVGDEEDLADSLTLARLEATYDVIERAEMGWECFPDHDTPSVVNEALESQPAHPKALLVSQQTSLAGSAGPENGADDRQADDLDFDCSEPDTCLDDIPMNDLWMFGGIDISLPRDIAAGEYRIVSDRGDVRSLKLSTADLAYHGQTATAVPRDLYTVEADGTRWYFVRIKQNATNAQATTASIDWQAMVASIRSWNRSDVQLTVWRWGCSFDQLQRRMSAVGRRSQKWGEAMTQTLWHALKMMETARRLSAEKAEIDTRL